MNPSEFFIFDQKHGWDKEVQSSFESGSYLHKINWNQLLRVKWLYVYEKREVSAADEILIKEFFYFIIRHLVCDTSKWKISN